MTENFDDDEVPTTFLSVDDIGHDDKLTSFELELQPLASNNNREENGTDDDTTAPQQLAYPVKLDSTEYTGWRRRLEDFLFPPHLPRSCQLLRPENIAVPACYLLVGLLQGLSSPLVNVLPLDLGATEAQQTTISSIRSLPASFKLMFGFLSDNFPIHGPKETIHVVGWLLPVFVLSCCILGSNLHDSHRAMLDAFRVRRAIRRTSPEPPADAPSIPFLSLTLLGFGTGFWLADVMGDSIVAEKAKLEPPESRGSIQSTCYSYRFFGIMVAAPLSTYLYATAGPYYVHLAIVDNALDDITIDLHVGRSQGCSRPIHFGTMFGNLEYRLQSSRLATHGICVSVQCPASEQCCLA